MSHFLGRLLRGLHAGEHKLLHHRFAAPQTLIVFSSAFGEGKTIPRRYHGPGRGENISPSLAWSGVPQNARSLALVMEDPDVPLPFLITHLIAYFPASQPPEIAEGALSGATPPAGVQIGINTLGKPFYAGPRPPPGHGPHRYVFQLFALDFELAPARPFTRKKLTAAMKGHVLAWGRLTGVWEEK